MNTLKTNAVLSDLPDPLQESTPVRHTRASPVKRPFKDARRLLAYITLELVTGNKTMATLTHELRLSYGVVHRAYTDGLHHAGCGPQRRVMSPSEVGAGLRAWIAQAEGSPVEADSPEWYFEALKAGEIDNSLGELLKNPEEFQLMTKVM